MNRKNDKGVTVLQVLQNGASRLHFEGLQNSSRLICLLGRKAKRLGTGTTRNEQLHREIKSWFRNIVQSHEGRLQTAIRIFSFAKILTHSSASYSPTLSQCTQSRLLYNIAGKLRRDGFFPKGILSTDTSLRINREGLHSSVLPVNLSSVHARSYQNNMQKAMWAKRKKKPRNEHKSNTDIFRRPRKKMPKNFH